MTCLIRFCCILSFSYIKPQLCPVIQITTSVVYYPFPTSNHNRVYNNDVRKMLYTILFLHQTTTFGHLKVPARPLYTILFLHQTTTILCLIECLKSCILSFSYIKPQRRFRSIDKSCSCILSFSYIKPQPGGSVYCSEMVVYYPFPTSNHNKSVMHPLLLVVVYYPFPTSNHNGHIRLDHWHQLYTILFLHQTTTYVA